APRVLVNLQEATRVDQDCFQLVEVVIILSKEEKAGVASDGHLDLVGDGQPRAALPELFRDEDAYGVAEPGLLRLGQQAREEDILVQVRQPRFRKGIGEELLTLASFAGEEHRTCS